MKKLLLVTLIIANGLLFAMDRPDGWQPARPSGSGRPPRLRPQAINYGTAPALVPQVTPVVPAATPGRIPTQQEQEYNDTLYGPTPLNPMHIINTHAVHGQPVITNPMHIINTGTIPAAATPMAAAPATVQAISAKEQDRLDKIENDLDKIEDVLKDMGIDLACAALSAACLDPIGAAFSASSSLIHIPKLAYYYGNMQKHIFFLSSSKTSPEAKARLKQLTPRLQTVSRVLAKGPENLQKLIKKFSKEEPKEAK